MSRIVLAQTIENGAKVENLRTARRLTQRAKQEYGADMIVFPEGFMSHYPADTAPEIKRAAAEPIDGSFTAEMQNIARENGLWVVFGTKEASGDPADTRSYNCVVMLNDRGEIVSTYRKTHLYDAFGYKESDNIIPGDRLFTPVETPFGKIGIFVCYELRFPEIARYEAMNGADIIIVPTAWARGDMKSLHFRTMVTARAIENTVFVLACDMYGGDCMGETVAVDPMGVPFAMCGEGEALVVCDIDLDRIAAVRKKLPSVKDRKPELYI